MDPGSTAADDWFAGTEEIVTAPERKIAEATAGADTDDTAGADVTTELSPLVRRTGSMRCAVIAAGETDRSDAD